MKVLREIELARRAVRMAQIHGRTVGLVPTMGALHEGHLSLVRASMAENDHTAVSIFVNPTQFGPNEDFEKYPRDLDHDLAACEQSGVDWVFAPSTRVMYRPGPRTTVHVPELTEHLCGAVRPGHFDGVATVVAKLLNILPADRAYFGEKDAQQLAVIQRMVADLNIATQIVGCPIVREPDGLAMSSRNAYLTPEDRKQATSLYRALSHAAERVGEGLRDSSMIVNEVRRMIRDAGPATIEYVEVVDPWSLERLAIIDRPARICVAVRLPSGRLIDNVTVDGAELLE